MQQVENEIQSSNVGSTITPQNPITIPISPEVESIQTLFRKMMFRANQHHTTPRIPQQPSTYLQTAHRQPIPLVIPPRMLQALRTRRILKVKITPRTLFGPVSQGIPVPALLLLSMACRVVSVGPQQRVVCVAHNVLPEDVEAVVVVGIGPVCVLAFFQGHVVGADSGLWVVLLVTCCVY